MLTTKGKNLKTRYLLATVAALLLPATAFAADNGEAVFKKNICVSCHQLDKKSVGPALNDIAAKYAGDKNAQAKLETKVRNGGSGSFGTMPMPANSEKTISDADIKVAVAWIRSLK